VRVLVNAMCTLATRSGIGHHTSELVRAIQSQMERGAISAYPSGIFLPGNRWLTRQAERHLRCRERGGMLAHVEGFARRGLMAVAKQAGRLFVRNPLDFCARRGGYRLYHEPNTLAVPCSLPLVLTIHDLSVLLHPEWHPPRRVAEYGWQFEASLKRACHLLAVSEFTRQEIVRHLGWPAERITVTYNGRRPFLRQLSPSECALVLRQFNLKPGYLLHVGTIEPRKNIGMLLKAHASLPREVRERHPLVLVGGSGWKANDIEGELASQASAGTVRRLGYCPDDALAAIYSSARALVFPTFYEGFGLPTIEMMACGGAVLASTASAVAETVGGKAHLIDPHDEAGWRDAMLRICTDGDWWNVLRDGAEEVAKPFTWERCASETLAGYRRALGEPQVEQYRVPVPGASRVASGASVVVH
jgi:glycosyltransferase involved in cell wall biosynthesis